MTIIPIPGFSEPFSSLSHLIATAVFAISSALLLYHGKGNGLRVFALTLYAVCVVYLFSMSGVYHLLEPGGSARDVFQRLDHAAIWTMIAGTFTPIHIILFKHFFRWGILSIIWVAAITGLVLEVVFFKDFPEYLSLSLYLGLGWLGVASGWNFSRLYKGDKIQPLVYGGIAYSIGGIMEFLRWPILVEGVIGPHEIFHVFVILGAYYHWKFIYSIANLAIREQLTLTVKVRPKDQYFVTAKGEDIKFTSHSRPAIYSDLKQQIEKKYRKYTRPRTVRLQYVQEEFMDSTDNTEILVPADRFYP